MPLEDIEKLKERLEKNPDSKLFIPLAEEYRKAEMFDEAIEVLRKGLELQPSYMSARVALGKIYLEKAMLSEAKSEFEEVIKTIPDNLFAHKKLAQIYKELGEPDRAVQQYETVLELNPLDDEARDDIEALRGSVREGEPGGRAIEQERTFTEEIPSLAEVHPSEEEETAPAEEIVDAVVDQVQDEEPLTEENVSEDEILYHADVPGESHEIDEREFEEEFKEFASAIQSEEGGTASTTEKSAEPSMFYAGEDSGESGQEDIGIRRKEQILPDDEEYLEKFKTGEEATTDREAGSGSDQDVGEEPEVVTPDEADLVTALQHAEELVGQSRFSDALRYYNSLLERHPNENRIIQKLQELKTYLRMLGKDKEEVINRLEQLLSRIKLMKEQR